MRKFIANHLERLLIRIKPMRLNDNLILIEGLPTPAHPLQPEIDQLETEIANLGIRTEESIIRLQQTIERGI